MDQSDAIKFVRDIELAHTPFERPDKPPKDQGPTENAPDASVSGGQLVTFADGVTAQQAADITTSCLFAQLVASKTYNRETQRDEWYDAFNKSLLILGWKVAAFKFSKCEVVYPEVNKMVLTTLATVFRPAEFTRFSNVLSALSIWGPNTKPLEIFNRASSSKNQASFLACSAYPAESDNVAMSMCAFNFIAVHDITNVFWTDDAAEYYLADQVAVLDDKAYAEVRGLVIDRLLDQVALSTTDISI